MTINDEALNPQVCIAGGGPAGVLLALLLARKGIRVTLLESQKDFDRQFRGDTLHASSLEILDQLGLARPVLDLRTSIVTKFQMQSPAGDFTIADLSALKSQFPYVALVPQVRFLGYLVEQARDFPGFNIIMNATVTGLEREGVRVAGVRFSHEGTTRTVKADLVVGADGRQSAVRQAAGIELVRNAAPMDVLWFEIPRGAEQKFGEGALLRFGVGTMLVVIDRGDYWQVGYIILKGSFREVRQRELSLFREELTGLLPDLSEGFATLTEWRQVAILSVVTGRVDTWHQEGLLLIGDAAHVMSPVGGVGINYAINDAVATANVLVRALRGSGVTRDHLAAIQRRRELPVRFIQAVQAAIQKRIIASALKSDQPFVPPLPIRIISRFRPLRARAARLMAYGLRAERIED